MDDEARESRVRRWAKQLGLRVTKCRGPLSLNNLGGYQIVDGRYNCVVAGSRWELELDDVEDWLREYEASLQADEEEA